MTNLELVAAELEAAKKKHPHFVDCLFAPYVYIQQADDALAFVRRGLANEVAAGRAMFRHVLLCEMEEARNAYAHGDLAHARQELAQCAAVCIRAMEHVEKEMENKTKC